MSDHKVVEIKITYQPDKMEDVEGFEKKIEDFLHSVKDEKGVKVSAKRHNVAVDVILDEYGL